MPLEPAEKRIFDRVRLHQTNLTTKQILQPREQTEIPFHVFFGSDTPRRAGGRHYKQAYTRDYA